MALWLHMTLECN